MSTQPEIDEDVPYEEPCLDRESWEPSYATMWAVGGVVIVDEVGLCEWTRWPEVNDRIIAFEGDAFSYEEADALWRGAAERFPRDDPFRGF